VADTDNFDYAIDLYLEGLRLSPDALEAGHAPLRKLSLIRQGKGGKKPSITKRMTHMGGKTPVDEMLNAEYLLAKDPDNLSDAESMLKAAVSGGYRRTGSWIADLVLQATKPAQALSGKLSAARIRISHGIVRKRLRPARGRISNQDALLADGGDLSAQQMQRAV
jgi:hypothetical protein